MQLDIVKPSSKEIIKGIGDDAAVIKVGDKCLTFTTNTLVEGDHFSLKYFTPQQVGKKAVEINVSDIGAMGAKPSDCILASGDLGSSTAGLHLFLKNIDGFKEVKRKHTEPETSCSIYPNGDKIK